MKKLLSAILLGIAGILCAGISCLAQDESKFEIPRYPVDIEGVVQDDKGNLLKDVTLCVTTKISTKPFTVETKTDRYERKVSGKFRLKLPEKVHSMNITAKKEGFAPSSEYSFDFEQLSAKDVIIRLIPAVRQSRLETGLGRCEITKEGKSSGFSFREWREIPLKVKPLPTDMCIYLEVTGNPTSFRGTNSYSVTLVGTGVEFCEAFLPPPVKYIGNDQRFEDELLQAPESGYVSRIEVNTPHALRDRIFYFKTQDGKYGKFWIEGHHIQARDNYLKVRFTYYFQPDGTRNLAQESISSSK